MPLVSAHRTRSISSTVSIALAVALAVIPAAGARTASAGNLDQCANGPLSAPTACSFGSAWVNGHLNGNQAHYLEDQVVPFRIVLTGLAAGNHTVTIEWDTLKGGKHAYDFIYNHDYTESTADPCAFVAGCSLGSGSYAPIPLDPTVPAAYQTTGMPASGSAHDGEMALYGGTINTITVPGHPGGTDDPARVTISLNLAAVGNAVLAWGGHVGDHHDWGPGSAAQAISGSPYHMRLLELDGSGGNQDRSISSDAVYFPSSMTIVKNANPDGPQDFAFTTAGGLVPAAFALDDDQDPTLSNTRAYPGIVSATKSTFTFTEAVTSGWTLGSIGCATVTAGGGTVGAQTIDVANRKVSVPLDEGEEITCTFQNAANTTGTLLERFTATRRGTAVLLRWRTGTETGLLGFNLYRGRRRLNSGLIPAHASGRAMGSRYLFQARAGGGDVYRLELVKLDGSRRSHETRLP